LSFKIGDVEVEDTFAEAFPMYATRLLITALNEKWALTAARVATGFATSIIMSPAEAGIERLVPPEKTPDKRVGALIHIYHRSVPELKLQTIVRVGQCILTCPTTALFDGVPKSKRKMHIGEALAKFGDGFEVKDTMYGKVVWRIPVMEGEFILEDTVGVVKAVAGGNFFILASSREAALEAAEKAVEEISKKCRNVVLPFPGGIVRSGSKVGSLKYPKLAATTNHLYCPAIRDKVPDTKIPENVKSVMEIVINGLDEESVMRAMGVGVRAACSVKGVVKITAGNYGGKLGPYKMYLKDAVKLAETS
jgi:formylmethanofuran--tetrahydromethanopterin N-formyltransferase